VSVPGCSRKERRVNTQTPLLDLANILDVIESVKWRVAISCPLCGSAGSAILSESADEPPRDRFIEALSQGFIGTASPPPVATIFLCAECHVPAFSEPQGLMGKPIQPLPHSPH
jgi:hypothetical protein